MEIFQSKYYDLNKSYCKARVQSATIAYIILCLRGCLGWLGIDTIFFTVILNLFIIISVDYTKINKSFLFIPFLCLLILINKQVLGTIDIIALCLILKHLSIRKLARIYFYILLCFIPIWLALLNNDFIESKRWFDPNKGGEFFDYGFANPNGLGIFGFNILASLFVVIKRNTNFFIILILFFVNQVFYELSNSRTAWIGGIVLVLCAIVKRFNGFHTWMKYFFSILPIVITLTQIYLAKHVDRFVFMDILLSGRLSIYNSILSNMSGLNWLLGIKLPDGPMDGSYMMLLFTGGILTLLYYWFLNYRMMICSYNLIKPYLPFILSIMACGIAETTFSSCGGLSLLYWFLLINSSYKKTDAHT